MIHIQKITENDGFIFYEANLGYCVLFAFSIFELIGQLLGIHGVKDTEISETLKL